MTEIYAGKLSGPSSSPDIVFDHESRKNLTGFFDVLIRIDKRIQRDQELKEAGRKDHRDD